MNSSWLCYSSDELIILALKEGLHIDPLYQELCHFPFSSTQDMWKVAHMFAIANDANDAMRHKVKQENHKMRVGEERTKPIMHIKPNVFDKINKAMVEPRASPYNVTPLTRSRTEILGLHGDTMRSHVPLQVPPHKRDWNRGVISIKTMGMTPRLARTTCTR